MIWPSNRTKASNVSNEATALGLTIGGVDEASLEQVSHDRDNKILVEHDWSVESASVSYLRSKAKSTGVLITADRPLHHHVMEHQRGDLLG